MSGMGRREEKKGMEKRDRSRVQMSRVKRQGKE